MNGCSIDYQLYSTVNMHWSKFAYFQRMGGWLGGRNLIIKTISAELDCAELGNYSLLQMSDYIPVYLLVIIKPSTDINDAYPICLIGMDYGLVWWSHATMASTPIASTNGSYWRRIKVIFQAARVDGKLSLQLPFDDHAFIWIIWLLLLDLRFCFRKV